MGSGNTIRKRRVSYDEPGHAHELTFSCYRRQPFLSRDRTRSWFALAVNAAAVKHEPDVWAYVIMPEHVHLLIYPRKQDYQISLVLKSIKQSVSRRAIEWLKSNRPDGLRVLETGQKHERYRFWQDGGGYDRNITELGALKQVVDCIHANPVRRGLAERPEDWPWSSYRQWTFNEAGPIEIHQSSCRAALG